MSTNEWSEVGPIVVDDCLAIKENENVLLVAGEGIEKVEGLCDVYTAVKEELNNRGFHPTIISYYADIGVEAPFLVENACVNADVIICIYARGFLHSGVFPRIQRNKKPGARILMLPNGNNLNFLNRMMPKTKEEFYEVADVTERIGQKFVDGVHHVHLTSENGTDLSLDIGTLMGWTHSGICRAPGSCSILPGGSVNVGVTEGSAEGTLVIDTYTAAKKELLKDKIVFEIHNGHATSITGSFEADDFVAAANIYDGTPEEKFCISEFGLGFHKVADITVNPSECEQVNGAAHIGIGSNAAFGGSVIIPAWHVDCMVQKATVELDGQLIVKDGEYLV